MTASDAKSPPALGFLTVVSREPHGLFGGYLVLNLAGRPLEFHCTAPLKPNRAQQILYGPTLEPYLYGEHIGRALVQKSTARPLLICTNRQPALALRSVVDLPVVLVGAVEPQDDKTWRIDDPQALRAPHLSSMRFGHNTLGWKSCWQADEKLIAERLADVVGDFDLLEPFSRIEEAIDEAQRAGR